MENETKARIFAQYLGKWIIRTSGVNNVKYKLDGVNLWDAEYSYEVNLPGGLKPGQEMYISQVTVYATQENKEFNNPWDISEFSLLLKSPSAITDEDAIEVVKLFYWHHLSDFSKISQVEELLNRPNVQTNIHSDEWLKVFQYLQYKGYALPQTVIENNKPVTYSVEQLVQMGVYKLIE